MRAVLTGPVTIMYGSGNGMKKFFFCVEAVPLFIGS